jgi:uncharacterized protein
VRTIALGIIALQIFLGQAGQAQSQDTDLKQSVSKALPLFEKNNCKVIENPADQLFCGDPELSAALDRLSSAIQKKMNQLAVWEHYALIENNAEWGRDRNSSCGISGRDAIALEEFQSLKGCLLKETTERISVLSNPDFDCLTANSAAKRLICSDPDLVKADNEVSRLLHELLARANENQAKVAFEDQLRWMRARDRRCNLDDKEHVPDEELPTSKACVIESLDQRKAEIKGSNGDPVRLSAADQSWSSPDASAVDACVAQIYSANVCHDFLAIRNVRQIDRRLAETDVTVIADVEIVVRSPFAGCSAIAVSCTGTCWDMNPEKVRAFRRGDNRFAVAQRLRVQKSFVFLKGDSNWQCTTTAFPPINEAAYLEGPW